ncbi:DUF6615 family protein [Microbacterium gorillae]|uniref:DUF6615 family protein n=1 Tax=Microbacterium gorillae TaxID=1231063 RepID=UPI003D983F68
MTALNFFKRLKDAMDRQAEDVWEMVQYSRDQGYRLRLGEVTTTELNFFRLRDFWSQRVYIDINEPEENATGADWEWVIGHDDKWLQIRVQAKMMNASGSFDQLGHPRSSGDQMRKLLNPPSDTVSCRWMPLYVFYAAEPAAKVASLLRHEGCSAQLARVVSENYNRGRPPRKNARKRAIDHLHVPKSAPHVPTSIPWSGIFDGLITRLESESLVDIVDSLANRRFPANASRIDDFWDVRIDDGLCGGELPGYLQKIVDARNDRDFASSQLATLGISVSPQRGSITAEAKLRADRDLLENRPSREMVENWTIGTTDEAEAAPIPRITMELGEASAMALPSFVSIIDVNRLPEIGEHVGRGPS